MYGIFYSLALRVYKWACIHKIYGSSVGQVEKDLRILHPGENVQQMCTEYYVGKLAKSFMVGLVGVLLAIMAALRANSERILNEEGELVRGGYGEAAREVEVQCVIDRQIQNFIIALEAQVYGEEEIHSLYEEFHKELEGFVLGSNESLAAVTENLVLQEAYEGYPFYIEWECEDSDIVHRDGRIERGYENPRETKLTARISYGEWEWLEEFAVTVLPVELTETEQKRQEMEDVIRQTEADSRSEKTLKLPDCWQGQTLSWKENTSNYSIVVLAVGLMVAVGIFLLADKDLHDAVEKRKRQMQKEYPDMVHKLTLYLGAGITIRGAFYRLAEEYEKAGKEGQRASPLCEEILHTCRQLKAGVSEGAAYEQFGKRTGVQEYVRLCTLLIQNLKKGNSTLLQRLREEAQRASLEQLQYGKRLCEEAVTKLLFPMVLLLLVVMLMIMIPAFSTMGV